MIQLDDTPVTVIGVMPQGFRFIYQDTDFWGAFGLDRGTPWREVGGRFTDVIARIAPDATLSSADSRVADDHKRASPPGTTSTRTAA